MTSESKSDSNAKNSLFDDRLMILSLFSEFIYSQILKFGWLPLTSL